MRPNKPVAKERKTRSAGPIAFFISLLIIALGSIQLIATFRTYAYNLAELNALKKEESSLIAQKQELENNILRWNDNAYITAQARERLGFVFAGEEAIRVMHPEAVTGEKVQPKETEEVPKQSKQLPWYTELGYSFKEADNLKEKVQQQKPETQEHVTSENEERNKQQDGQNTDNQNADSQNVESETNQ